MSPDLAPLRSVVIVGPTASGKSALAFELAQLLGDAEIVSVDSMQVYRGMDIGTAKPSATERSAVAHHLLDLVVPAEEFSVSWFQQVAFEVLDDLARRRRRAILVGGTGLYQRAVVDRLEIPGQYPEVVASIEAAGTPTEVLHRRLLELDPVAANRMEQTNRRRVLRALEVTIGAGRPFSSFGPGLEEYPATDSLMIGLSVARDQLGPRISERLQAMLAGGFEAEVAQLHRRPDGVSRTAGQALGYREFWHHLDGECTREHAIEDTSSRTRQFAVRQDRWFRRDPRIDWFDHETESLAARIADTLEAT